MKKLWILLLALTLLYTASALADRAPIVVDTPGETTIVLDNEPITATSGPAISVTNPAAKVTIILTDNTRCQLNPGDGSAGIEVGDAEVIIRCESANKYHTCSESCGELYILKSEGSAGIGSGDHHDFTGKITVMGGQITISGGDYGSDIGSGRYGDFKGTVVIAGGIVYANDAMDSAGLGAGDGGNFAGTVRITGGYLFTSGGENSIGPGLGGSMLDGALIEVDPVNKMFVYKNWNPLEQVEDSPFTTKTDVTGLAKDHWILIFEHIAPTPTPAPATPVPATPVPSPTPAPGVPATGDSMNFALLAVLAVMGMIGITVLLRKRNEA